MNFINLPTFLRARNGRHNNITLIGTIAEQIEPHEVFKGMYCPPDAVFAVMDMVGIRIEDISMDYYVKGYVIVLISKTTLALSKKKKSGRGAFAITGVCNLGRGYDDLVYSVGIRKREGKWALYPLTVSSVDKDKFPEFYDVIASAYKNNWEYSYGKDVPGGYVECGASEDFIIVPYSEDGAGVNTSRVTVEQPVKASNTPPKAYNTPASSVSTASSNRPKDENTVPVTKVPTFKGLGALDTDLGLGVGAKDTQDLLVNKQMAEIVEGVKNSGKIGDSNRLTFVKKSKLAKEVQTNTTKAERKVMTLLEELSKYDKFEEDEENEDEKDLLAEVFEFTFGAISKNWDARGRDGASTGRAILKDALDKVLPEFKTKGAGGTSIIEDNITVGKSLVLETILTGKNQGAEDNKFLNALADNRVEVYLKIIETALGIRGKLVDCYRTREVTNAGFINILTTNPYHLCLVDSRFKIEDLDKLAMLYGINIKDKEVQRFRNVAYLHNYMLDNTNMTVRDNTAIQYAKLKNNLRVGYVLGKNNYDYLIQTGVILTKEKIAGLKCYINKDTKASNFALPQNGWRKAGLGFILATGVDSAQAISDYIASGLGVKSNIGGIDWITDYNFVKKELAIYNKVYELGANNSSKVSDEDIKQCIADFEELQNKKLGIKDFKLEKRQADSLYLIKHGVMAVTGPAGSGKTTTAEALIYAIERLLHVDPDEIMFCAPTGKAANRLREVVKRPTRTIHSLFGVGGASYSIKNAPDKRKNKKHISVLIVDESSMINIDLMYDMISKLDEDTRVIFLGDVEQLPPIGFGKPFANLLNFIPCAVLNVSKRASDKSGITRNAKDLIYNSDKKDVVDLIDTPDFKLVQESDQNAVVENVKILCRYHLGQAPINGLPKVEGLDKLNPDDIQVISPVNKNVWGTKNLNKVLHDIFNPVDGMSDVVVHKRGIEDEIDFRIGDRVIHTSNSVKRTRFTPDGKYGSFRTLESTGVMNGDVGKVVGVFQSTKLEITYGEEGASNDDEETSEGENKLFVGENVWYLAVKYHDVDTESGDDLDYIIMYQFELYQRMGYIIQSISSDLGYIDLAYALTVHKLQGSQAKLVIGVLLPVKMKSFISRNMIYTLITRAQKGCYLVGEVKGASSVITEGRKIEQTGERVTMLDNIIV